MVVIEILVVLCLIVLNGFFAMAELALVSARKARLEGLLDRGQRGAAIALNLLADRGRFLSAVQIGITLIGIFAGAFSGATLAQVLAEQLRQFPALKPAAEEISLAVVVVAITYLSLIVGELVPKQLALRNPERIAGWVARPMAWLVWLATPLVWLLDVSTRLILGWLRGTDMPTEKVTDEEIKTLIAEAAQAGVVEEAERKMIAGVMRLADRPVRTIMTPRRNIVWLDLDADPTELRRVLRERRHDQFPVSRGDVENVLGVVRLQDLLHGYLDDRGLDIAAAVREPVVVPDSIGALRALELIRQSPLRMALVVDEYGNLEGLVTATDILESIVGTMATWESDSEPEVVRREDGSWLVDGALPADELKELLGLRALPREGVFHTAAGFVLAHLDDMPKVGDHFTLVGYRFEVVDMDGLRVDKILVNQAAPTPSSARTESDGH